MTTTNDEHGFAPHHPRVGFDLTCFAETEDEAWRTFIHGSGAEKWWSEKQRYLTQTEWRVLPTTRPVSQKRAA